MMELIAIIVLAVSALGMGAIIYSKIPVLAELQEYAEPKKDNFLIRLKNKIKNVRASESFSSLAILQKVLSRVVVLLLKIENKAALYLQKLREQSKNKKLGNDNYWQEIKNSTVQAAEPKTRKGKIKPE